MNDERYDSIDYDAGWQTTQTVSAAPVKAQLYRGADDFSDDEEEDVYMTRRRRRYEDEDEEYEEKEKRAGQSSRKAARRCLSSIS